MEKLLLSFVLIVFTLCYTTQNPIETRKRVKQPEGCVCEKFSCGCCVYMDVPQIWLNDTACVNFAYDPKDYGISFTVTIDDTTLINETISARNPPPICFPAPLIEDFVDVCMHFYDLAISNTDFHGCVQLEARMWWIYVIAEIKLGCFDTNNLSKECNELLKQKSRNEVLFPNVQVNNESRYEVVSMQGKQVNYTSVIEVHLIDDLQKNSTQINETQIDVLQTSQTQINQTQVNQTQVNRTSGNEVPSLEYMCQQYLSSKSNLVNFSPYILFFLSLSCFLKFSAYY